MLQAHDARAECTDTDGDDVAGITGVTIDFREPGTGTRLTGTLRPTGGEIDASGRYPATLTVAGTAFTGEITAVLRLRRVGVRSP